LTKITETLIGTLAYGQPNDRLAYLVSQINNVIKPPRAATVDNVNIRAMYVVNDLVNSHGGRFCHEELASLCRLMADSPVLIGHNRAGDPLARTFHAELEKKEGILWLKSYFYWPKSESRDEFLDKIDSGVFKECSISFTYTFPECSVCGEDIRRCPHDINLLSPSADAPHFFYRGVTRVLETSLVFKGSVPGTHITDRLGETADKIIIRSSENQMNLSIPREISEGSVSVFQIGNKLRDYRVISSPDGIMAAIAVKDSKPFIMLKYI